VIDIVHSFHGIGVNAGLVFTARRLMDDPQWFCLASVKLDQRYRDPIAGSTRNVAIVMRAYPFKIASAKQSHWSPLSEPRGFTSSNG
jgi:hypothetical protein